MDLEEGFVVDNILKYSNGWGHLIMSIALLAVGLCIMLLSPPNAGYGIGLITTVVSAWFIPGAAKQVAYEQSKNTQETAAQVVQSAAAAQAALTPTPPGGNV